MSMTRLIERLERTDWSTLDAGGVTSAMRDLARLKGFLAHTEHAAARRANELAAAGSGAPASELIGRSGHCSSREAEKTSRRAETLGAFPAMSEQLGKGRIGVEHADAIATATIRLDDDDRRSLSDLDEEFARHAATSTPGQFKRFVERVVDQLAADRGIERAVRQRNATQLTKGINDETGMYWLRGEFDPETGARLFRALDAETRSLSSRPDNDGRSRQQLAALALVDLATSASRSRRPGRTEILTLVDIQTITDGLHEASVCELDDGTPLPVETLRRLACDAHIIPIVLNGAGVPLDVGRSRRLATDDQRRALRAMYRTCGIGDCDVPFDRCEIHHLAEWTADQGETNLDSLIPGCSRHHHLVHEGGWRLELDPVTRELTIWLPDGTLHSRSRPHSVAAPTAGRAA
jgi:Domain of unknown function (DUF222)